ncbi:MAG: SNF2-related protein, partial [Opitutales bacterium]
SKGNTFENYTEPCLWVASYTQLRRHRHLLDKQDFRYAILDEAQLIKNPKAKVTQACLSIEATHRLALSGTPIENSALDLWTIFRYLMP